MQYIGLGSLAIGFMIALFYHLKIVGAAFRMSVWMGLGSFFIPIVWLMFVCLNWSETKSDFLKYLCSMPFLILGVVVLRNSGF